MAIIGATFIKTQCVWRVIYIPHYTYATQELFSGTDIHTLAKQMGTSVRMLEMHYSKLTATMAAEKLA